MAVLYNASMPQERLDRIVDAMTDEIYSRLALYDIIYRFFPAYTPSSCDWVIGTLKQQGYIRALGNGFYAKGKGQFQMELQPGNKKILTRLLVEFPFSQFACIETNFVNEQLGMEGGDNCFIVEVTKRDLFPCYMKLREWSKRDVLITPTSHELDYYMKPNAIVLKPLFSKSPVRKDGLFCIEKLLVDSVSDKLFDCLYPHVDIAENLLNIIRSNNVNVITTYNYAKRRRCEAEIRSLLRHALPEEVDELIPEANTDD